MVFYKQKPAYLIYTTKSYRYKKKRKEKNMKTMIKKYLLAVIAFALAMCFMPTTAKADEEFEMGIVRMNLAKNSMALSGRKM